MQSGARLLTRHDLWPSTTPSGVPAAFRHATDVSSAVFHATKSSKTEVEEKYVRDTIPSCQQRAL